MKNSGRGNYDRQAALERHPDRRCVAKTKGTGEQCRRFAIAGATVCRAHGGGAPQVRERARERVARTAAMRILEDLGTPPPDDGRHPIEHLLEELRQSAMVAGYLGGLAATEGPGDPIWRAWERERDRRAWLAKTALGAGIEERHVRVAESNAVQLATALRGILTDLGIVQDRSVVAVVQRRLRALSAGPVDADGDAA